MYIIFKVNRFINRCQARTTRLVIPYTQKNEQLDQCCQQVVAMFCCTLSTMLCCTLSTMLCCTLSTTVVNKTTILFTVVHGQRSLLNRSMLTIINKLVSSTIVSSCSDNIVTTIVLCQHRTTIDRTILINIVNLTSVVEP